MGKPFPRTFSDPEGSRRARIATTAANKARKAAKVTLTTNRGRLLAMVVEWEGVMTALLNELTANARELRLCDAGLDAWKRCGKQPTKPYRDVKPLSIAVPANNGY